MRLILISLILALPLAACGRGLTPHEQAFLATVHGDSLDMTKMRLHDGLAKGAPVPVPPRPRLTCQERLYPPRTTIGQGHPGAMALFQHVYIRPELYQPDLTMRPTPSHGAVPDLADAMLLAHEATHVWQWQNRALTGYHPLKAALEHAGSPDPYLFDPETEGDFLSYGYEQQGAIVEEFVCCRTLASDAPRTERLYRMIAAVMPVQRYADLGAEGILLPWQGVTVEGICD